MQQWLEDKPAPKPAGFCDGCGAPVTDADRFCTACGRPLREFCSWCGTELPADGRVCVSCGRPTVRDRARIYERKAVAGKPIAGFGFRAGVYLVDGLIQSTLTNVLVPIALRGTAADSVLLEKRLRERQPETFSEFIDILGPFLWWAAALFFLGLAVQVVWNSIGWSPAQRIIGLRMVDAEGHTPGWRRGLGRTAASLLSGFTLGFGYLAAAWHPEKRTWHDRMAGTWVVDVREQR